MIDDTGTRITALERRIEALEREAVRAPAADRDAWKARAEAGDRLLRDVRARFPFGAFDAIAPINFSIDAHLKGTP